MKPSGWVGLKVILGIVAADALIMSIDSHGWPSPDEEDQVSTSTGPLWRIFGLKCLGLSLVMWFGRGLGWWHLRKTSSALLDLGLLRQPGRRPLVGSECGFQGHKNFPSILRYGSASSLKSSISSEDDLSIAKMQSMTLYSSIWGASSTLFGLGDSLDSHSFPSHLRAWLLQWLFMGHCPWQSLRSFNQSRPQLCG